MGVTKEEMEKRLKEAKEKIKEYLGTDYRRAARDLKK